MIEVVSIKFKNRGKCYYFDPAQLRIHSGDKVIVETSKGLEIADCARGNHTVDDALVVQPLRPVVRLATADDLRVAEINRQREKEAFDICQQKIAEHQLDMKLVDVECNFEGSKTMFFFTSDGRVDFRDLVKDLAGIFRNRIELRQIGVRDEAKMLGGIGICGRPYCCNQFLDDFQPVSTKMAKVQSLSLNPTKISGSCGRLMCCLRYEQEAYEDLLKSVPKQGAFVQTKDGYGTAVQVNLLRQTVKVKLDKDSDDNLHLYNSNELAAVPGGRPKDGVEPPSVLDYVPEDEIIDPEPDMWQAPVEYESASVDNMIPEQPEEEKTEKREKQEHRNTRNRHQKDSASGSESTPPAEKTEHIALKRPSHKQRKPDPQAQKKASSQNHSNKTATVKPVKVDDGVKTPSEKSEAPVQNSSEAKPKSGRRPNNRRRYYHGKPKSRSADKE